MVQISKELCIGCGLCVGDCPSNKIRLEDGKARFEGKCIRCGHCVAICPVNAVSIPAFDMDDVRELDPAKTIGIDELIETIRGRRSIRSYKDKNVEEEKLLRILEAGRYTPTGGNIQENRFIIVQEKLGELKAIIEDWMPRPDDEVARQNPELRRLLSAKRVMGDDFLLKNAPAVLYIAAQSAWDAGLAAQNVELAAIAQGLGVLHNEYLRSVTMRIKAARELLELDERPLYVAMLLGYPDVEYVRGAPRKAVEATWL